MELITLNKSKKRYKNVKKYLISWESSSRSKFQTRVKNFLEKFWDQDVIFEEFPVIGTRLSLDFYNANKKVAIEVQGRQHTKYVKFFHGDRLNYLSQLKRDQKKETFCELNQIKLVTIYEKDIIDEHLFESQGVIL
jgi:very-short-patch-repair endonuclease|tara:strand:- start:423 stop:830 length:408 start_codon:yes stop_codon:yes gene_type:complete